MAEELHRVEIPVAPAHRESVAALLWALGARGVWERSDRLVAWVGDASVAEDGRLVHAARGPITVVPEPERDWQAAWKATIAPVRAGRTVVVPSWLAAGHVPGEDELTLVLDPGQAFGTGHHATTALCLELLDELDLAGGLRGRGVLDIGCGSGILAITAAARGAVATAVDLDPDAVAVTRANASANGVGVTAQVGAVEDLQLTGEVVVANLISDVVRDNATHLLAATGDRLLVSGITEERAVDVLEALVTAGAEVLEVRRRDGWIAAVLAPRPPGEAGEPPTSGGSQRGGRWARSLGASLAGIALLAGACSEPEVVEPGPATPEAEPAAAVPTPEEAELLGEVTAMAELLSGIDAELVAAVDAADLTELRAAIARADAILVADPAAGTPAVFPSQAFERGEQREPPDALSDVLTSAREVGGELGRSVVEKLRDPIAGDLGTWDRDAPGVVATARGATDAVTDEASAGERVLALVGEGPRAIAWVSLAAETDEVELARTAAERARDHVEVMMIALELATGPAGSGPTGSSPDGPTDGPTDGPADGPTDELGPGGEPDTADGDATSAGATSMGAAS